MSETVKDQMAPGPNQAPRPEEPPVAEQVPPMGESDQLFQGEAPQPQPDVAEHTRLASIRDKVKEAVTWTAPVVGAALKEETGVDPYRFTKEGQPELTSDQSFAAGVARFALRRGVERLAARASYS